MVDFIWGWFAIAFGLVVATFGARAFKLGLAAVGFAGGYLLAFMLLGGAPTVRNVMISLIVGVVGAVIAIALVRYAAYIAGAMLGLAAGLVIANVLGLGGGGLSRILLIVLAVAGIVGGGFLGPLMGDNAMLLAANGLGALMIVSGFNTLFQVHTGAAGDQVERVLSGPLNLTLFIVLVLLGSLGQLDFSGFGGPGKR